MSTQYEQMSRGELVDLLQRRDQAAERREEPVRTITVRMPTSLHEALKAKAHKDRLSMNALCVNALQSEVVGGTDVDALGEANRQSSNPYYDLLRAVIAKRVEFSGEITREGRQLIMTTNGIRIAAHQDANGMPILDEHTHSELVSALQGYERVDKTIPSH